jgi:hypothetical protein
MTVRQSGDPCSRGLHAKAALRMTVCFGVRTTQLKTVILSLHLCGCWCVAKDPIGRIEQL